MIARASRSADSPRGKYMSAHTRIIDIKINVPARRRNAQPLSSIRRNTVRTDGTL